VTFSEPIAFSPDFRMLNVMADIPSNPVRLP
jgi:hypothetical protein